MNIKLSSGNKSLDNINLIEGKVEDTLKISKNLPEKISFFKA